MLNSDKFYILKDRIKALGFDEDKTKYYFEYGLRQLIIEEYKYIFEYDFASKGFKFLDFINKRELDIEEIQFLDFDDEKEFINYIEKNIISKILLIEGKNEKNENVVRARKYSLQTKVRKTVKIAIVSLSILAAFKIGGNIVKNAEAKAKLSQDFVNDDNSYILECFIEEVISNMQKEFLNEVNDKVLPVLTANLAKIKQLDYEIEESKSVDDNEKVELLLKKRNTLLIDTIDLAAKSGHIYGGPKYKRYDGAKIIDGEIYYPISYLDKVLNNDEIVELDGELYIKDKSNNKEDKPKV